MRRASPTILGSNLATGATPRPLSGGTDSILSLTGIVRGYVVNSYSRHSSLCVAVRVSSDYPSVRPTSIESMNLLLSTARSLFCIRTLILLVGRELGCGLPILCSSERISAVVPLSAINQSAFPNFRLGGRKQRFREFPQF